MDAYAALLRCALLLLSGITFCATPLPAQPARFSVREIGQIIDATLVGLRADASVSATWSQKEVAIDLARILKGFGYSVQSVRIADLDVKTSFRVADWSQLADCDALGRQACTGLGERVYFTLTPDSTSATTLVVLAKVFWAERRAIANKSGAQSRQVASLVGFGIRVYLTRAADGAWRFARTGAGLAG